MDLTDTTAFNCLSTYRYDNNLSTINYASTFGRDERRITCINLPFAVSSKSTSAIELNSALGYYQGRPSQWKFSRIIETHPGTDDMIKVAAVKTDTKGVFKPIPA